MAGIGADIKEVLEELGEPIIVYKLDGSIIYGEFCDPEAYYEHSTEFIRQNCYAGTFAYDTTVTYGDIVSFNDLFFLMLNVKPTTFEREKVDNLAFFVQCNVSGRFARFVSGVRNSKQEKTGAWVTIGPDEVKGLQVESGGGVENTAQESTILNNDSEDLYCQAHSLIKVGYRWYPDSEDDSEFYEVAHIQKRRYQNCYRIRLKEDKR